MPEHKQTPENRGDLLSQLIGFAVSSDFAVAFSQQPIKVLNIYITNQDDKIS